MQRNLIRTGAQAVALTLALAPAAKPQGGVPSTAGTATSRASAKLMQLRCRGGPSGLDFKVISNPSTHNAAYVTMSLHYRRSEPARPGADVFAALNPGTCSWNDPSSVEPEEVTFDLVGDAQASQVRRGLPVDRSVNAAFFYEDTATVPRFMTDPGHYYSFFVWDRGDNFSGSHGAYQIGRPPEGSIAAAAAGTSPAARPSIEKARSTSAPRLKFVESNTSLDFFNVKFTARSGAAPVVTYSAAPPIRDPLAGQRRLGASAELHLRSPISMDIRESTGNPSTYIASTRQAPERGRTYYFLITVPAGDGVQEEQYSGRLVALSQTVRVVFTQVVVTSARLDHLHLRFIAGNQVDTVRVPDTKGTFPLNSAITIPNAPDRVHVTVEGLSAIVDQRYYNSVAADIAIPKSAERVFRVPFRLKTEAGTSTRDIRTWNEAKKTYDQVYGFHPGDVMFEISGYLEVTRK